MASSLRRVWFGFLLAWITTVYLMTSWFFQKENCQDEAYQQKIESMTQKLAEYEHKIGELSKQIRNQNTIQAIPAETQNSKSLLLKAGDAALFELQSKLFRKTSNSIKEFWWYLRTELEEERFFDKHRDVAIFLRAQFWAIQRDVTDFRDKNPIAVNRMTTWNDKLVSEFEQLQNPTDCSEAKYIYCTLSKSCGFGCHVHHLVYCFIVAYAHGRTLVLDDNGWSYDRLGWNHFFKPISSTQCHDYAIQRMDKVPFSNKNVNANILSLSIIEDISSQPYLPNAVPEEIARNIEAFHGHPSVWWIGQIVRYLMRPNELLDSKLQEMKDRLGFKKPIVGMHIRRTDKVGIEAAFHDVSEYFSKAEEFHHYINLTANEQKLRVYLATDEAGAVADAKLRYPHIEILNNGDSTNVAGVDRRYTPESLLGVAMDILLLSECDYLICTFSSQVCRLAYEIMQTKYTDATWRYYSLDDIWYYGGQQHRRFVAIMDHNPRNGKETELKVGDEFGVAGNEKNGFSLGNNRRTGGRGLVPSYKIEEVTIHVKLPRDGG